MNNNSLTTTISMDDLKINIIVQKGFIYPDTNITPRTHHHSEYELHFIYSGETVMMCADSPVEISGGDLLIIAPGVYHYAKRSGRTSKISLQFSFKHIKTANQGLYERFEKAFSEISVCLKGNVDSLFFDRLKREIFQNNLWDYGGAKAKALFTMIFIEVYESISANRFSQPKIDVNEAVLRPTMINMFISENFRMDISADDMADFLHISRRQLFRYLKKNMGCRFSSLLARQRIEYAIQLMDSGATPTDAAYQCGYKSYNGFSKAFSAQIGMGVREYLAKNKA